MHSIIFALIGAVAILVLLGSPLSSFADGLAVTTNKNTYPPNERIFVFGVAPADTSDDSKVGISVFGPNGQLCQEENATIDTDNAFVSKPFNVSSCGFGTFNVVASFSNLNASSSFTVSSKTKEPLKTNQEVQKLKQQLDGFQNSINSHLKQLSDSGVPIPNDYAEKYGKGKEEYSLALQALEFGNASDAKIHGDAAASIFSQLSNTSANNSTNQNSKSVVNAPAKRVEQRNSAMITEEINRLTSYSSQLQKLAVTNNVNDSEIFSSISGSLANASALFAQNDTAGAQEKLAAIASLLDNIHSDLYDHAQQRSINSTIVENHKSENGTTAETLSRAADRIQNEDNSLLAQNSTLSDSARNSLQDSLSYVAKARADISQGNFQDARKDLSEALNQMAHAKATANQSHGHHNKSHK